MNKLDRVEIPDEDFVECEFLKAIKYDINDCIDNVNSYLEEYYELQKACLYSEEARHEMAIIEPTIDACLFQIRDRISLMKDPTLSSGMKDNVKSQLYSQIDSIYDKCKARQNLIS